MSLPALGCSNEYIATPTSPQVEAIPRPINTYAAVFLVSVEQKEMCKLDQKIYIHLITLAYLFSLGLSSLTLLWLQRTLYVQHVKSPG